MGSINQNRIIMTQDYFVFPPFEVYTGEQLTKEVKQSLIARGLKCVAIVFNCESYEDFERKYFGR